MKRLLSYTACIIALGTGSISSTAVAQTTANGPYYATPSWDQTLPSTTRFIVLSNMGGNAVMDRETGLVWERSPLPTMQIPGIGLDPGLRSFAGAQTVCITRTVGGRKGWRLPTIQELASLIDPTVAAPATTLPPGHPFIDVDIPRPNPAGDGPWARYWSATTLGTNTNNAYYVDFLNGGVVESQKFNPLVGVWCVRGGQGVDPQ